MRPYPRLPKAENNIEQLRQFYAATATDGFERVLITRADGRKDQIYSVARTPQGLDDVRLSDRFARHVVLECGQDRRERFAHLVLPTLQNPFEVYWRAVRLHSGKTVFRQVYLGIFEGSRKTALVAQEDAEHGVLAWTFYSTKKFHAALRKGERIYP